MINFIPLKQSEEFLPIQNSGGKLSQASVNFKDIFKTVSNNLQKNQDNCTLQDKKVENKVASVVKDNKNSDMSDNSNEVTTRDMQEISEKIEAILKDDKIEAEEMESVIAMIMNFINNVENTISRGQVDGQFVDIQKLFTSLKEKMELLTSKLNGDFSKPKIMENINKILDKLDSLEIKSESHAFKQINFKYIFENSTRTEIKENTELKIEVANISKSITEETIDLSKESPDDKRLKAGDILKGFSIENVRVQNVDNTEFKGDVKHIEIRDIKDIIKIIDNIEMAKNQGVKRLTVQLHPENLGKLEIQLVESGGKINAKIFTDNEQTRFLLVNNIEQMRNQLNSKGIHIDNMEFSFMMANDDKGKRSEKDEKNGLKFGGSLVEETTAQEEINGLYA